MIKVGIVGGAGYTGGELLRILVHHPEVNIVFVHSKSNAGKFIFEVHEDLIGDTELTFASEMPFESIDVVFLCLGHGESKVWFAENLLPKQVKCIDLSQDFRPETHGFVYGLPELQKEKIKSAQYLANPGCFATCLQLGLLPLAAQQLLQHDVHISATTGSTGAGQSLSATSHFTWRQNNLSVYKAFSHQHLKEIKQSLVSLQPDFKNKIQFIPYRGAFTRGIFATGYTSYAKTIEEAYELYESYYQNHPFVHITKKNPDLKQVINTNKAIIYLEKHEDQLMFISMIDNLIKGASGQAVQNMNLMFGLDEKSGLGLKSIGF